LTILLLIIVLLILEPFLQVCWKKSSGDFFFGIKDNIRSDSDRIKSESRIKREGEKKDIKKEYANIIKLYLVRSKQGIL